MHWHDHVHTLHTLSSRIRGSVQVSYMARRENLAAAEEGPRLHEQHLMSISGGLILTLLEVSTHAWWQNLGCFPICSSFSHLAWDLSPLGLISALLPESVTPSSSAMLASGSEAHLGGSHMPPTPPTWL